jgi:hypothetical protein
MQTVLMNIKFSVDRLVKYTNSKLFVNFKSKVLFKNQRTFSKTTIYQKISKTRLKVI